jgi:ferredoxin-like protein FixX
VSLFIDVEVAPDVAGDPALAAKLAEVCPVDIYAQHDDGSLRVVEQNLDECVQCRLCIDAAPPGTVVVRRLYDDGAPL